MKKLTLVVALAMSVVAQVGVGLADLAPNEWLLLGPFPGPAGLAMQGLGMEEAMLPAEGDVVALRPLDRTIATAWRAVATEKGQLELSSESLCPDMKQFEWPRGCLYLACYARAQTPTKLALKAASTYRHDVWLGEERVTPGGELALGPKWQRLLVKVYAPRGTDPGYGKPWSISVVLVGDTDGVELSLSDPERAEEGWSAEPAGCVGHLVCLEAQDQGNRFTYVAGEPVGLYLVLRLLTVEEAERLHGKPPEEGLEREVRGRLSWVARDMEGSERARGDAEVALGPESPCRVSVDFEAPAGHYQLWCTLYDEAGKALRRFVPQGLAVVPEPRPVEGPKRLGCAFYWLSNEDSAAYLEYLRRCNVRVNLGLKASWCTKGEKPGVADFDPRVVAAVEEAGKRDIEIVGWLDGGWPREFNPQIADRLRPKQLLVWLWHPLPDWDSHEYEQVVRAYVQRVVRRFGRQIRRWHSYNEVDISGRFTPELYLRIMRLLRDELLRTDPTAGFVGASFCRQPEQLFLPMAQAGGLGLHDAVDVHCYPLHPPSSFGQDISLSKNGGVAAYRAALGEQGEKVRFWWGEVGARRSLCFRGAAEQAEFLVKMTAVGLAQPGVDLLCFCDAAGAHAGDFSLVESGLGALPATLAYATAARYLDGRPEVRVLAVGNGIQAARFDGPPGPTVVAWSTRGEREIEVPVTGDEADQVDVYGRSRPLAVRAGRARMTLTSSPVFLVRAEEGDEG